MEQRGFEIGAWAKAWCSHGHNFGANAEVFMKLFLQSHLDPSGSSVRGALGESPAEGFCKADLVRASGQRGEQMKPAVGGTPADHGPR